MSEIKGKLEALKLNGDKNGKPVHYLKVNGQTYTVDISNEYGAKVGSYVAKAKVGDDVIITLSKFGSIAKFSTGSSFNKFGSGGFVKKPFIKKEYDATGPIQGMVLNAAIQMAIADNITKDANAIVGYAKVILEAKKIVDALVVESLGKKEVKSDPFDDLDEDIKDSPAEEPFGEDSDPF